MAVPSTTLADPRVVGPSRNVTVPLALTPVTVAVSVTVLPAVVGFSELLIETAAAELLSFTIAASMSPALVVLKVPEVTGNVVRDVLPAT